MLPQRLSRARAKRRGDLGATVLEYPMSPVEGVAAFERIVATSSAPQLVNSSGDVAARYDEEGGLLSLRVTEAAPAYLYPALH